MVTDCFERVPINSTIEEDSPLLRTGNLPRFYLIPGMGRKSRSRIVPNRNACFFPFLNSGKAFWDFPFPSQTAGKLFWLSRSGPKNRESFLELPVTMPYCSKRTMNKTLGNKILDFPSKTKVMTFGVSRFRLKLRESISSFPVPILLYRNTHSYFPFLSQNGKRGSCSCLQNLWDSTAKGLNLYWILFT